MFSLVYSSIAITALNSDELDVLLGTSRRHNVADNLTGLLLHVVPEEDGRAYFVQVLEGEQSTVERTYARIQQDELHADLQVLSSGPVAQRSFGDWDMRLSEIYASQLQQALPSGGSDVSELIRDPEVVSRLLHQYVS